MSELQVLLTYFRNSKSQVNQPHDDLVRHGFEVWRDDNPRAERNCTALGQSCKADLRKAFQRSSAIAACFSTKVQKRGANGMSLEPRYAINIFRQVRPAIPARPKRCKTAFDLQYRDEHQIDAQSFLVGEGANSIDDAITIIILKGPVDKIKQALQLLQRNFNGHVSEPYDHGNDEYEVMVYAPVGSAQVSILAKRCGIDIQSIDHVGAEVFSDFVARVKKHLESE